MAKGQKCKFTPEHCRNISIGRLKSPIIQAKKQETQRRKQLEKEIKLQRRQEQEQIWGSRYSPEIRARMSQAKKGYVPWNVAKPAWNRNKPWPDTVKQNISKGMMIYHMQRKQNKRAN